MSLTASPLLIVAAFALLLVTGCAHAATLRPTNLRCEYKTDPLGIESPKPRLSWLLETDNPTERGQAQSAYEILVASSRKQLDKNSGDRWSTGQVKSDETIQLEYAGKKLSSSEQAFWKVRVWNGAGHASEWSAPATWTMGLLDKSKWNAKWIGYDAPVDDDASSAEERALTLEGAQWVWTSEEDAVKQAAEGDRYFAKTITIPQDKTIRWARFFISVDDHCDVSINGSGAGEGFDFHKAQMLEVQPLLRSGENVLAIKARNSKGPAGLVGRLMIFFAGDDKPMTVDINKSWKVSTSQPAAWPKGPFDFKDAKWTDAKEVAVMGGGPWGKPEKQHLTLPPPPYFRKAFSTDRAIKRALVHASALGIYELHLNGKRVGEDYFTPGWTEYKKRVDYNTYDVTSMLMPGSNVMGAILGDGWYAGYYAWGQRRGLYGKDPRLMVQLDIEYADGSHTSIATDDTWKCAYGPIRQADLIMGCAYDAMMEIPGWDAVGFDDSKWQPPMVLKDAPKIAISAYCGDPVRRREEIAPVKINEPRPAVYVFDMGQNLVGWARFKLNLEKGQTLQFRYSEMLTPDGLPYVIPLRGARVIDYYTAKGGGEETWEPIFTSHGFRYVEITGLKSKPSLDTVTGVVAYADMARTGTFECSSKPVNQLFHNIIWGQKGNYFEVPTDCPQRDERMGWTGDAQFFIPTAAYNFDVAAFFTKWLIDLDTDAQYPDGSFADVAPDLTGGHGNVAWGDAGIVCPYIIYQRYDDTRIVREHWTEMVRYIDFLTKNSKDHIRGQGAYGDWLNLGGGAKAEVVGTAYYQYVVRLMSEMARAIGKEDDAAKYEKLAEEIKAAFIKEFVAADGSIKDSSQTGYALAFTMGLIPADRRAAAGEKFVDEIKKKDWHLATGFIGTPRLLPALTAAGKSDVAYKLLLTDTFPSWLYQVKLGATTMWERWDGWTPDKGFQDPAMNSFNHYAFGSVGQWMYSSIAGIDTGAPGFKRIILRPQPGSELSHATGMYDSIRGTIESSWKRDGETTTYKFTIPVNTTATVHLHTKDPGGITEGGKPARSADGVKFLWSEGGVAAFQVTSGMYEFVVR